MKSGYYSKTKSELLELLKQHYVKHKLIIQKRLEEFRAVSVSKYFYELVYCILTPQSSALNAIKSVRKLKSMHFYERGFNPERVLRDKNNYIRFHKRKSIYLLLLRNQYPSIKQKLEKTKSPKEIREWLVKNVKGMGYKEASHFLRNIGKGENLAILDRHILRILKRLKIINSIPGNINKKTYLSIERRLCNFSREIGISPGELDLVLWSMATDKILK